MAIRSFRALTKLRAVITSATQPKLCFGVTTKSGARDLLFPPTQPGAPPFVPKGGFMPQVAALAAKVGHPSRMAVPSEHREPRDLSCFAFHKAHQELSPLNKGGRILPRRSDIIVFPKPRLC
jgi:hypothetical protein